MVYMCHVAWLLGVRGLVFVIRGRQRRGRLVPETNGPTGTGCDPLRTGASAAGGLLLRGRVYPKDRSAALGAFYSELRKWVLKEDEAAVAELMGVSPGHVREVLAGRKPGYGVLCLLVEYATENRAAGRMRVVRSAARRAEQVEELRLDFMTGTACSEWHVGTEADMRAGSPRSEVVLRPDGRRTGGGDAPLGDAMNRVSTTKTRGSELAQAAGGCDPLRTGASADKLSSSGDAMNRVSTAKAQAAETRGSELRRDESRLYEGGGSLPAQDVTNGVIDFNGMEG